MKSWVEYITKVDGDNHGWRSVFHFGDWLALDNPVQGAEQVMGATDEEFIANLYYAISAGIVAKAAGVLGYREEQEKYQKLSEEQFAVVQEEYYSATGRWLHQNTDGAAADAEIPSVKERRADKTGSF